MAEFDSFVTGWRQGARSRDSYREPKAKRVQGFYESNLSKGSGLLSVVTTYIISHFIVGQQIDMATRNALIAGAVAYPFGKYVGRHFDNMGRKKSLEKKVIVEGESSSNGADYK
jgi:hypothetical protein